MTNKTINIIVNDSLIQRFWRNVQKGSGCWEWKGKKDRDSYGKIKATRSNRILKAHRVSYAITHGDIPEGMSVLHACDNPACVRPDHLWAGTIADNNRDMKAKGRSRGGINGGVKKMTPETVQELRELWGQGWSGGKLAKRFGIGRAQAWRIATNQQWRSVK